MSVEMGAGEGSGFFGVGPETHAFFEERWGVQRVFWLGCQLRDLKVIPWGVHGGLSNDSAGVPFREQFRDGAAGGFSSHENS